MKLATLKHDQYHNPSGRDGALVLVSRDLSLCQFVPKIAPTLQYALDHGDDCRPRLETFSDRLNAEPVSQSAMVDDSDAMTHRIPFDPRQ